MNFGPVPSNCGGIELLKFDNVVASVFQDLCELYSLSVVTSSSIFLAWITVRETWLCSSNLSSSFCFAVRTVPLEFLRYNVTVPCEEMLESTGVQFALCSFFR